MEKIDPTKALKYDSGTDKLPWDLLPYEATEGMLRVLLYGQRKYTVCEECGDKVYKNPRLDGDLPTNKCPTCGSDNIISGSHNWRKGFAWSRLVASSFRHLVEIAKGNFVDRESGLNHTDHLACCVAFLSEHLTKGYGVDDINRT